MSYREVARERTQFLMTHLQISAIINGFTIIYSNSLHSVQTPWYVFSVDPISLKVYNKYCRFMSACTNMHWSEGECVYFMKIRGNNCPSASSHPHHATERGLRREVPISWKLHVKRRRFRAGRTRQDQKSCINLPMASSFMVITYHQLEYKVTSDDDYV